MGAFLKMTKEEELPTYIFPKWLANPMSKVPVKVQYESSMMGMTLILFGIILTAVYLFIYMDFETWYKVVLIINALAGIAVLGTGIITTYQQYIAVIQAQRLIAEFNEQNEMPMLSKKGIKRVRYGVAGFLMIISLGYLLILINSESFNNKWWALLLGVLSILLFFKAMIILLKTQSYIQDVKGGKNGN